MFLKATDSKSLWSNVTMLLVLTAVTIACVFLSSAFDSIENKKNADFIYKISQQKSIIEHVSVLSKFFAANNKKVINGTFDDKLLNKNDIKIKGFDVSHARSEVRDLVRHLDFLNKNLTDNIGFLPKSINKLYFGLKDSDYTDGNKFNDYQYPKGSIHYKIRKYIDAANKLSQLSQDDSKRIVENVDFISLTARELSSSLDNSVTLYYQYLVDSIQDKTDNHWAYLFIILVFFVVGLIFFVINPIQNSLKLAYEEAALANRIKTEFLTSVSHEIRTPMHGIISASENLSTTILNDKQSSYVRTVLSSAESLLDVINDILGYSSLESGDTVVEVSRFNLYELIGDLVQIMEERAQLKNVELILRYEDGVPHEVGGDSSLIRQVFYHLISNAIKFTETGYIVVTVDSYDALEGSEFSLKFSIEDTGIGISEKNLSLIFEQFVQGNGGTTRLFSGTGLGLSICKKLVALMGGTLRVGSVLGEGSTFSFVLPLVFADNTQRTEIATSINFSGSILFICDDSNFKTMVLSELGMSGMQVVCVNSIDFIGRTVEYKNIALIAVDYFIKSGSPIKISQHAHSIEKLSDIPLVCISRKTDMISTQELMNQGFLGFFNFPNDSEQFTEFVSSISNEYSGQNLSINNASHVSSSLTQQSDINYLEGSSILLVEDNRINATLAEDMLKDLGALVTHAENGQIAVEYIKSGAQFDLVLMDCMMPIMDGFKATQEIRNLPQTMGKTLPIVALTANAMVGDKERCLDAGMSAYLSKPVRKKDLQTMLGKWLHHRKLTKHVSSIDQKNNSNSNGLNNNSVNNNKINSDSHRVITPSTSVEGPLEHNITDLKNLTLDLNKNSHTGTHQQGDSKAIASGHNIDAVSRVAKGPAKEMNTANTPQIETKEKSQSLSNNSNGDSNNKNTEIDPKKPLGTSNTLQFLDANIVAKARKMMKRRFPTMIEYFLEDTQGYIDQIRKGLSQEDVSQLVVPSHTIKSSARQMGALEVSDLAKEIEALARTENTHLKEIAALTDQLQEQFDLSRIDFNNLLSEAG